MAELRRDLLAGGSVESAFLGEHLVAALAASHGAWPAGQDLIAALGIGVPEPVRIAQIRLQRLVLVDLGGQRSL